MSEMAEDFWTKAVNAAADEFSEPVQTRIPTEPTKLRVDEERWAWLEIDLGAIEHNIAECRKRIDGKTRVLAVVKANAYGHGAVRVAHAALKAGASYLAVATVDEGKELRRAGITAPILILAQPPYASIPALLDYDLMPAVQATEFALALGAAADARGVVAGYHLQPNTGMNRVGILPADAVEFMRMTDFHRGLKIEGTFTHFATADEVDEIGFALQLQRFTDAIAAMRAAGFSTGLVHCANSAAAIRYHRAQFDMVRLGIVIYGLHPSDVTRRLVDLRPAMSVRARINMLGEPAVGEGVSYGFTYRSPGNVIIATIPIGYADGLARALSNKMDVLYRGHRMPQVGNICMDQFMFEIDKRNSTYVRTEPPKIGDLVTIIGRDGEDELTLDAMADELGTINYELACRFGLRMKRIYLNGR